MQLRTTTYAALKSSGLIHLVQLSSTPGYFPHLHLIINVSRGWQFSEILTGIVFIAIIIIVIPLYLAEVFGLLSSCDWIDHAAGGQAAVVRETAIMKSKPSICCCSCEADGL